MNCFYKQNIMYIKMTSTRSIVKPCRIYTLVYSPDIITLHCNIRFSFCTFVTSTKPFLFQKCVAYTCINTEAV